jgi:hypothetical protein
MRDIMNSICVPSARLNQISLRNNLIRLASLAELHKSRCLFGVAPMAIIEAKAEGLISATGHGE